MAFLAGALLLACVGAQPAQAQVTLLTGTPAPVTPGSNVNIQVTLDVGPGGASNVDERITLPPEFEFASLTAPGGWSCSTPPLGTSGTVTCLPGTLPTGPYDVTVGAHVPVGTPTSAYNTLVNVTTSDAGADTEIVGIFVTSPTITMAPTTLPAMRVGVPFSQTITPSGGTAPYTFAVTSGTPPAGLVLPPAGGVLSGTPTAPGPYSFTVRATDASGFTGFQAYSGTVGAPGLSLSPASGTIFTGAIGSAFSQTFTASGGLEPYDYRVSGTIPAGLSFAPSTGALSGTPTTAGTFNFTIVATDGNGREVPGTYSLTIPVLATTTTLTSSANPSAAGQAVTLTATVSGGSGTPTGSVTFLDGGSAIGTASLTSGVATFTTAALTVGTHAITASYGGGGGFDASTSAILTQTVSVAGDSIRLRQMQVQTTKVIAQVSGQAVTGAVDSAISEGFDESGEPIRMSEGGMRLNFAAEPAARRAKMIDDAFGAVGASRPAEPREWLAWAEVKRGGIDPWDDSDDGLSGSQVNALVGLTRKVTPTLLVGAFGGYETFDYTSEDIDGRLEGDGWTIGSYLGWKLTPSLRFDAAFAYSDLGFDGSAGTAEGDFDGRRWLLSSGLTGTHEVYGFQVEPSARVYALWEREDSYTDTLGTFQDERDFATGRASGGVKVAYPLALDEDVTLAPYVGLYGDYYFTDDDAADAGELASVPLLDGWSARAAGGISAKFGQSATVAVGGELGGIGSDTSIWSVRARAAASF